MVLKDVHIKCMFVFKKKNQKVLEELNWGGPSDDTAKTEGPCHSRSGTIKIPPFSKLEKYAKHI